MPFVRRDREYNYVVGSDVPRDGMHLEVAETQSEDDPILEIFYSDQTDEMTLTTHLANIPLELVEWAISAAK